MVSLYLVNAALRIALCCFGSTLVCKQPMDSLDAGQRWGQIIALTGLRFMSHCFQRVEAILSVCFDDA